MQNDEQRPGQPPIHTQLPDSVPDKDVNKIVGDPVPHSNDYNDPPPKGASKSTGGALDDTVGGPGLGAAPDAHGATTRVQDSRADDQHMGNRQQGNQQQGSQQQGNQQQGNQQQGSQQQGSQQQGSPSGQSAAPGNAQRDTGNGSRSEGLLPDEGEIAYNVAEEVSLDQQSDHARKVGSMEEAAKGPHGDKLAEAVAGSLGKDSK